MNTELGKTPHKRAHLGIGLLLALSAGLALAQAKPLAGKTVKIAWIDPQTGLMGPVGNNQLNTVRFMAEKYNATNPAGVSIATLIGASVTDLDSASIGVASALAVISGPMPRGSPRVMARRGRRMSRR